MKAMKERGILLASIVASVAILMLFAPAMVTALFYPDVSGW